MFDIVLSVCLAGADICADRLLPAGLADAGTCRAEAPGRAAEWLAATDGLVLRGVRCADAAALGAAVTPLEVTEIAEGVFVHAGQHDVPTPANAGDLANLGFVTGEDAVAVIDAGSSRALAERLYAAIRARTALPIRWLVLTHMHPDHSFGASLFRDAGARILGHPDLEIALANRAGSYTDAFRDLLGPRAFLGTRLIGPDESAVRREIDLGGRVLVIEAHPIAHTETDLTVLDTRTGTWFVGDLVFAGHIPALDGSILGWQAVLDGMAARPVARIVPGHGPPVLDWPGAAQATRDYLAALTAETRAAIAAGEPLSQAVRHIAESQRGDWLLFDEFNQRNATAAYKELEWE